MGTIRMKNELFLIHHYSFCLTLIKGYKCPHCENRCNRKSQVVNHARAKHKVEITFADIIEIKSILEAADKDREWIHQTSIVNGDRPPTPGEN